MARRRVVRRKNTTIRRTRRVKEPVRRTGRRRGRSARRGRTVRGRTARRGRTVRGRTVRGRKGRTVREHTARRGRTVRGRKGRIGMRGGNYDKDMDLDGVWVLVKKAVDSLDNTKRKEINEVEHPPKELSWDDFLSMYMSVAKDTNNRLVKKGDDHDDTFLAHGTLVEVKEGNDWREGVYRGFKKRYGWGKHRTNTQFYLTESWRP